MSDRREFLRTICTYVRTYVRKKHSQVRTSIRTYVRKKSSKVRRKKGWGGVSYPRPSAQREFITWPSAQRDSIYFFVISNSTLTQPSAQRESESPLGVAPFSLTGRPLFQLTARPLICGTFLSHLWPVLWNSF